MWYIRYQVSRTLSDRMALAAMTFALVYVFCLLLAWGAI